MITGKCFNAFDDRRAEPLNLDREYSFVGLIWVILCRPYWMKFVFVIPNSVFAHVADAWSDDLVWQKWDLSQQSGNKNIRTFTYIWKEKAISIDVVLDQSEVPWQVLVFEENTNEFEKIFDNRAKNKLENRLSTLLVPRLVRTHPRSICECWMWTTLNTQNLNWRLGTRWLLQPTSGTH